MGCVNRNGKEFKDLASRHNLDSNTLELMVHKYWLETGSEAFFPTDIYIQSQLGNTQYQEDGKNVRKLWQMKYSVPQEFSTLEECQQAYGKATLYFPKSAIVYYKNGKGNFVLSVKKPVTRLNYSKEDYLKDMDNMVAPKNGKTLNLDITEGQTYGIGKVQELYNKFNTDRTSQDLADRVFNLAKDLGINVSFTNDFSGEKLGRYNNEKGIAYKKSFLESDMMNDRKAPILLHETLHAISMYALSDNMEGIELSEPMRKFRLEMNSLYQDLKNNPLLKEERGTYDVREFVAELGNPVFRNKIQEIDKQNKRNESFWSRVLNAFKKLLGLHVTNNYYERSMNALDKAISAFDIDSYMRYTGMKSKLREKIANNNSNTQLNKSISVIKDAAVSGKWTTGALNELDNLAKDLEDGKIIYQRFPKEASRAYNQGGRANAAASILLGTNESSSKENPRSFAEKYERDKREQPIQERIIESWAKAEGIWHDNLDNVKGKELFAEGGEAKVFANDGDTKVIKILSTEYFITPQFALDRITLHNTLFPTASLKVIGFGRNSKGEFQFLVEQPFIQGEPATQEEIDRFITKAGFEKSKKDKGNTFISDDLYLSDLHDENVIKTPNGDLVVIDADLRLNTPDLNRKGKYEIDDNIVSMKDVDYNEFKKTLSEKQLRDELHLIRQEEADFDLVNGIGEELQKRAERTGPQDFTFNDGTTIKAPFKPNDQQVEALNAMDDFIKSDDTSMTLSGYAGTGKTSLMEMIAKKCQKQHKPVMFCATTNKAAAVLNDKVSEAGFKATTLNKTFGINVEVDPSQKSYNARNMVINLKDVDIMPGTTIIIDEASMINEENYKILDYIAGVNNLKIIYVGDQAQLAPVNEDQISKVFRNGDGKVITLTQVERTDDNAILKEATNIRNGKPLSGETSFNSKGEGVAYISPQHQDAINEVVSHYVKGLRKDPNYFRILAYTNKAVSNYNTQVRSLLGYDSPIPQVGEPMTGYANWGYTYNPKTKQGTYRFINSESYKVTKVGNPVQRYIKLDNGTNVMMEAVPLTLADSFGNTDTFDYMDIKSNPQNRQAAMVLAEEKKKLWAMTKKVFGKEAKVKLYQKINDLEKFLFVNDNLEDNDRNLLQGKTIDFGYALTIHKSQGSTFTNILMDDVDVSKSVKGNNTFDTIDIGDTTLDPSNAKIKSTETVDLGDFSNVVPESEDTTPSPLASNVANIKQQLEYVGVSRATDTVTIISNHIKKEGSPLHPESSNEVTRQLTDHLKSMGINVLGRAAMQKFFEEHSGTFLQMARAFGKEMPYLNSEHREQIPEVLNIVKANKYNKPGTDAVTLDSDSHKTIYLIDHSANKELADNLKKGDGFGIRKVFNVENIKENDIREIVRNIAPFYDYSPARVRHVLQTIGIKEKHLSKFNLDDEIKRAVSGNNAVHGKTRQGQSAGENGFGGYYDNSGKQGSRDKGDLGQKASSSVAEDGTEFFLTPQGEVYGFVDKDGNIYLDETKISPEHPIHEYTHLWDRAVAKNNPELWNRGVELMKQTSLWDDVLNDEGYGKRWQGIKGMTSEKMDSLIASEIHARLTGEKGAQLLDKLAKEKGQSGIISKLKQWILDVWKDLKNTFSPWTKDELEKLTLEDFNHMAVRDFTKGINPMTAKDNTINNNNNGTGQYKQTDEFRRVQEAVRGSGKEASRGRSVFEGYLTPDQRQHLADVLERQLGSIDSFIHGSSRNVINQKHGTSFNIHSEVNPTLFHDIFEVVRYYTKNAELVDLHDDYSDCKCYLSEDGTTGFAIEPDGNLVSVFNLGTTRGFLGAIKDLIREEGATHLDAYASSKQNLEQMYSKTLGFHTAATMDYNMEYDHDDIAKNHGNPQVVFMVDHEVENPKHFDKNSYDEAKHYQMTQLNNIKQEENEKPKVENPTFEQGKTFTVKLPSYKYFNDLYEDSTVDAEWKIPYLQKLDSQLSDDNTAEENQDIINQMNTIMDATSEKEYNQQLKDPKGVKKTLSEYERFIQQLDNLLEGGDEDYEEFGFKINASEVRHTAELIINEVSDEITRLQTEEGRAKEIFPEIKTKIDFKTATRRQIVDAIGINTLLDRVKNLFDSETAMYDENVTSFQADLITENWDAFITMAADVFALNEGFGITKDYSKGNFTTTDEAKADFDNFNDYSNDPDVVAEEGEKDEQEHWQVEMKTIDVLNSMSDLVRQGLRECYLLDEKGEKVMSKWGIAERVNPRKATNSILRWTQGSMSLDDMVTKLSDKSTKNPWLSQLVEKLSDKSGKYTDFQSQFYGVFQKHFQPYSIVVTENGKYHSMLVNSHPALTDAMKTITSKFKTQTHPLFIGNRIKKEALGSESTIGDPSSG